MTVAPNGRHVEIAEDGEVVAFALVEPLEDRAVVRAALHTRAGHLPAGTRSRLVDAVLDLPEITEGHRLEATLPIGDAESLDRLRERCEEVQTRPAGASCLLDAILPACGRRSSPQRRKPSGRPSRTRPTNPGSR